MIVRLLLILTLLIISLFCWLSFTQSHGCGVLFFRQNHYNRSSHPDDYLLCARGAVGVCGDLGSRCQTGDSNIRRSRQEKKRQFLKEEFSRGMDNLIRGDLTKAKGHFGEVLKKDPTQIDLYLRLSEINYKEGKSEEALHWLERARLIDLNNVDILLRES